MNASGFSDNIQEPSNETLDKNNFSNIKLLKSIHDESFNVANEFFKEGFVDDDDKEEFVDDDDDEGFVVDKEGFVDDDEVEGFVDDDLIEGMKSKSKSKKGAKSKGSKGKNSFDIIAWAVHKAKGTIND
jgi:hypothetical protein